MGKYKAYRVYLTERSNVYEQIWQKYPRTGNNRKAFQTGNNQESGNK
nr:MAG TPA: hypothetical protein [Caudoviricetes sp.]